MKITGVIEAIEPIAVLKTGPNKKGGTWTLYGTHLIVGEERYGITAFSEKEVCDRIAGLAAGDQIEADVTQKDQYWNVSGPITLKTKGLGVPTKPAPVQKPEIVLPNENALAIQANYIVGVLMDQIAPEGITASILEARTNVFRELMLDRRTNMIQGYKQENMSNFRR